MTDSSGSANAGNPAANAAGSENNGGNANNTAPWYGTIEDTELRGFAELKGWKTPADALTSYRNLEKLQGAPPERLLKLPDVEDKAAWAEVHKKLGFAAPEKAEDYGLADLEGFDKDFMGKAAGVFHKNGLPKDMAVGTMKEIGALLKEMEDSYETDRTTRHNADTAALQKEWGANHDGLIETGKRAIAEYMPKTGLEDGDMDAIRDAIGTAKFNKLWAGIGSTMGEAAFHEGKGGDAGLGSMTPEAALARRNQLAFDTDWQKRYQAGDVRAVSEWRAISQVLAHAAASSGTVR